MGQEPGSLFIYNDASAAARNLRQAIYDGPFDYIDYALQPVILRKIPRLADGDATLEPAQVETGSWIVDSQGNLITLTQGTLYLPAGCDNAGCAQSYTGEGPASIDQLVVHFQLRPDLLWSDGVPLTAEDSTYSYELARQLYPQVRHELIRHTQSYLAVDTTTVEWRGIPGYKDSLYADNFFIPLPKHAWNNLSIDELSTSELANRKPLGWGPYIVEEWVPGDHITLARNLNYFRAGEGLPYFDRLVFRFVPDSEQALQALLAGECDFVDETAHLEQRGSALAQMSEAGQIGVAFESVAAWEHAVFGISSQDPGFPVIFQSKELRQAIARCIDRQSLVQDLPFGRSEAPDTYVPPGHPLANSQVTRYEYDPQGASQQLEAIGWRDLDQNPATPRLAQGVPNVPDGTPLEVSYLTTDDDERRQVAESIRASLAGCGVKLQVSYVPEGELFAPGPDGLLFGRKFQMAQFGWATSLDPPCYLYTSREIPGPYPDYPNGWGGANAGGYSNPEYDLACTQALTSLPDWPLHSEAHQRAQAIFADDLPAIPLYLRLRLVAYRPDLCGVALDSSVESALWNLESFRLGEPCDIREDTPTPLHEP